MKQTCQTSARAKKTTKPRHQTTSKAEKMEKINIETIAKSFFRRKLFKTIKNFKDENEGFERIFNNNIRLLNVNKLIMKRAIKLKKEINLKNDVTASNKLLRRTSSRADRNTTRTYLKLQETNETAFLDYHDVHEKVRVLQNYLLESPKITGIKKWNRVIMRLMSLITKLENSIIVSLGTAHLNIDHEPAEKAFYNIREKIMKKKFRFQRPE